MLSPVEAFLGFFNRIVFPDRASTGLIKYRLFCIGRTRTQPRHAVNHILHQVKAVEVVEHAHVEGRGGCSLFLVSTHVEIFMIRAAIGQAMNQPRVTMEIKNDRLVDGEQRVKILVL